MPRPQQEEFGSGQPTLVDVYRMFKGRFDQSDRYWYSMRSHFDQLEKKLDGMMEMTRGTSQRLANLKHAARQPRLAKEADGQAGTKTCERTEGVAAAVPAMHVNSCSADRVGPSPMCSTSFGGDSTGPLTLPCSRDDALVGNSATAPKSCLSTLETCSPTAAGGLLPTGETSTATSNTFNHSTLWFCQTEEIILRTSTPSASYVSSVWRKNLLAAPPAGGSLRQNQGKIGCLIQTIFKVVSAPARF